MPEPRFKIYISATQEDLGSLKQVIAQGLRSAGGEAVMMDSYPHNSKEAEAAIENAMRYCDAVVHLAGASFGPEPDYFFGEGESATSKPALARKSYAQMEYEAAIRLNLPLYPLVCGERFQYDERDGKHPASEPERLRELQARHRASLVDSAELRAMTVECTRLKERGWDLENALKIQAESGNRRLRRTLLTTAACGLAILGLLLWAVQHTVGLHTVWKSLTARPDRSSQSATDAPPSTDVPAAQGDKGDPELRNVPAVADSLPLVLDPFVSLAFQRAEAAHQKHMSLMDLEKWARQEELTLMDLLQKQPPGEWRKKSQLLAGIACACIAGNDLSKAELTLAQARQEVKVEAAQEWWAQVSEQLASCLLHRGKASNASAVLKELLDLRDQQVNVRALSRLLPVIGLCLQQSQQWSDADATFRRAVDVCGEDSSMLVEKALAQRRLAQFLIAAGRSADAEPILASALDITRKVHGEKHMQTAACLKEMGDWFSATGRTSSAISHYRQALALQEAVLQADHPRITQTRRALAVSALSAQDWELAGTHLLSVQRNNEKIFGPNDPSVAEDLQNLAGWFEASGRNDDALAAAKRALQIHELASGRDNPEITGVLQQYTSLLRLTGNSGEAEKQGRRALKILHEFKQESGKDHPNARRCREAYENVLRATGMGEEAVSEFADLVAQGKDPPGWNAEPAPSPSPSASQP